MQNPLQRTLAPTLSPLPLHYRLALPKRRQAKLCSRLPGGPLLPPSVERPSDFIVCGYRLEETYPPSSATLVKWILLV